MIKKFFKGIFKLTIGTIVIIALAYGGFHLWEFGTGGKYVAYLTENSETVDLSKNFSYEKIKTDIDKNNLILVGEIHGFEEPTKFDVDFFKYLHKNHGVNHYVAELDFTQACLLNEYLKTGDEKLLKATLKNWVVLQGRNNKDYFQKYVALHNYYSQLPENNKFEFIGIDKIQDIKLLSEYVDRLSPMADFLEAERTDMARILARIDTLANLYSDRPDTLFILSHLKSNVKFVADKLGREEAMFQNFYSLYQNYRLEETKVYGYFGLYHVFQYRIDGNHPLASKIRQSDLGLENKMLSINFMMNDSYMIMPSQQLPEFLRDGGNYTKVPVSADNMLIMYIYGIKDFKRMTPLNSKSLIKMDREESPYSNSSRLNTTFQILPVADIFEMTDQGKPYVQYTIFVRNSDWAEPMED